MMSEISSFLSPLLVQKVHDSQGKTNRSLFYTRTRSNRNLLATAVMRGSTNYDCYCETSNPKKILKSLFSSPAHIHMWITHTSTVGCKHWELESLLHGFESERSETSWSLLGLGVEVGLAPNIMKGISIFLFLIVWFIFKKKF